MGEKTDSRVYTFSSPGQLQSTLTISLMPALLQFKSNLFHRGRAGGPGAILFFYYVHEFSCNPTFLSKNFKQNKAKRSAKQLRSEVINALAAFIDISCEQS